MASAVVALPAAAIASRTPTHAERAAIIRTARVTDIFPHATVRVTDIRVSARGRWAAATVSARSPIHRQVSEDTFYRSRHRWIDTASPDFHGPATPSAVVDELGLDSDGRNRWLVVAILVGWFLALSGSVDVLLQPRRAFQETGRSKRRWLLVELAGAIPLVGILTWAIYATSVRPSLVRAGGRPPRKLLKALGAGSGQRGPRPVRGSSGSSAQSWQPSDASGPKEVTCPSCSGHRVLGCSVCNNLGHTTEWTSTGSIQSPCSRCHGRPGGYDCPRCHATGTVMA